MEVIGDEIVEPHVDQSPICPAHKPGIGLNAIGKVWSKDGFGRMLQGKKGIDVDVFQMLLIRIEFILSPLLPSPIILPEIPL